MTPFNSLFNSFPGKGLGKEESGISKAIKVNVKTDLAGVSYICFETVSLPPPNFSLSPFWRGNIDMFRSIDQSLHPTGHTL